MTIQPQFYSGHIEALKTEIRTKFAKELAKGSHDGYLKMKIKEALECLENAIVSVDILRSPDFNTRLDLRKNFYGLKLDIFTPNGHLWAYNRENIRKSIQMSMQMMNKKDMWKFFLSTVLMELQPDSKVDLMLRVGSDYEFASHKGSKADLVVAGPRPTDFPLLIADISEDRSDEFNPKKVQNFMLTTLVDYYNSRKHWPLTELVHLSVYGLIVRGDEFYISRMAMRPERGMKFAFVYTRGKRFTPRNLFSKPETTATFNQEALAQARRGDADSTADEAEESEDEWIDCDFCQTCHLRNHVLDAFGNLSISDSSNNKKKNKKMINFNEKQLNGAKVYRRPNGGSVTAIVSLIQTVLAQHQMIKQKDKQLKFY